MYCPMCGKQDISAQKYCRACGLDLESVLRDLREQFSTEEYAQYFRRQKLFENLGRISLGMAFVVALSTMMYAVGTYKAEIIGATALMWAALTGCGLLGSLAFFFFKFPKMFPGTRRASYSIGPKPSEIATKTERLIADPIPAKAEFAEPSHVTVERSTDR